MKHLTGFVKFLAAMTVVATGLQNTHAGNLTICKDGKTDYKIHYSKTASDIDRFAVKELQDHLTAMTGATFAAGHMSQGKNTIYVGLSPEAKNILGKDCLIDSLQDQDAVIQVKNGQLFLYGKGRHGNLYAVYELLENQLGCRWLSGFGIGNCIPKTKTVTIPEGIKKSHYTIPHRSLMNFYYSNKDTARLYQYRNRQNILLGMGTSHKWLLQDIDLKGPGCHVLSVLLPGFTKAGNNRASKLFKVQDYYAIHPEWFSMDENGKRVNNRQACFSNQELRRELTRNLMLYYGQAEKKSNAKYFYTLDLNDIAYNMCCCKDCEALQKKYQTPGGSFFDYLFELCNQHPDKEFATLAYQTGLTQIPPVGHKNQPKNLTVIFCPINGHFSGTLDKENIQDRKNLEDWLKITPKVWVWYYPNTYGSKLPVPAPAGVIERIAADIRTIARLKVDGTYFEHDSGGITSGTNFSEMQSYVMYKLFQNPALDEKALMKDFAAHYYGKAADQVLQYANELEKCRKDFVAKGGKWHYSTQNYHYLTEENLLRWNKLMDEAAKVIDPDHELRIRQLRMGLDCCIVDHDWKQAQHLAMVKTCKERLLKTASDLGKYAPSLPGATKKFIDKVNARIPVKPIPQELLAKFPAEDIRILLPAQNVSAKLRAKDPDANQGYALVEPWNGKKFAMGTYSSSSKQYGPSRMIYPESIVQGKYVLYKLNGSTKLTQDMFWWGGKWGLILKMGQYCKHDDPESLNQKWDIYISLKFTDDKVYVDRGFLVKAK